MDSVTLIESDVIANTRVKSSLGESQAYLVGRVGASVADVDEFCHKGKFVTMNLTIRDD